MTLKNITFRLAALLALTCGLSLAPSLASAQTATQVAAKTHTLGKPYTDLVEVNENNADDLLVRLNAVSFIVIYSGADDSPAQRRQIELIVQEAKNYSGKVNFFRVDVDKSPSLYPILTGRKWDGGPSFAITSVQPAFRGIITDSFNGVVEPTHSITVSRLRKEIQNFTSITPNKP